MFEFDSKSRQPVITIARLLKIDIHKLLACISLVRVKNMESLPFPLEYNRV